MGIPGRVPSGGSAERKGHLRIEQVEVADVPFPGPAPAASGKWLKATKDWWGTVVTMPHCVLWSAADWEFAKETGGIKDLMARQPSTTLAAELRTRSAILGMTYESRLKLRIRYVDPEAPAAAPSPERESARARMRRVK